VTKEEEHGSEVFVRGPSSDATVVGCGLLPPDDWQAQKMSELKAVAAGRSRDQAFESLIHSYEPFIRHSAKRRWLYARRIGGEAGLKDIVAAGKEGLLNAVRRWQPNRRPFSHFASVWIMQSCKQQADQLRQPALTIPARIIRMCRQFNSRREDLSETAASEFLEATRCRERTKHAIRSLAPSISGNRVGMDDPVDRVAGGPTIHEILPCENRHIEDRSGVLETILDVLGNRFTPRDRLIIYLTFPGIMHRRDVGAVYDKRGAKITIPADPGDDPTLGCAANHIGVTREAVRQNRNRILVSLKRELTKVGISGDALAVARYS